MTTMSPWAWSARSFPGTSRCSWPPGIWQPATAWFGGYKKSGVGHEIHKKMLGHYQQTKDLLVSYVVNPLGFF